MPRSGRHAICGNRSPAVQVKAPADDAETQVDIPATQGCPHDGSDWEEGEESEGEAADDDEEEVPAEKVQPHDGQLLDPDVESEVETEQCNAEGIKAPELVSDDEKAKDSHKECSLDVINRMPVAYLSGPEAFGASPPTSS